MADDITKRGDAARRRILGDAHVERSRPIPGRLDEPFIAMITDAAWGHVWGRDTISDRERSMMTIALLAGLGNFEEFAMHIRATARTGATEADVTEALLHVAIYAGVPKANHGFKIAREIFAEMEEENRK